MSYGSKLDTLDILCMSALLWKCFSLQSAVCLGMLQSAITTQTSTSWKQFVQGRKTHQFVGISYSSTSVQCQTSLSWCHCLLQYPFFVTKEGIRTRRLFWIIMCHGSTHKQWQQRETNFPKEKQCLLVFIEEIQSVELLLGPKTKLLIILLIKHRNIWDTDSCFEFHSVYVKWISSCFNKTMDYIWCSSTDTYCLGQIWPVKTPQVWFFYPEIWQLFLKWSKTHKM